ncbi:NAD(P)H-dependent oxidoreductase [Streptomyces tirandamycinicus]|uniref:NADPH-dependent FMN reductase n=1 Tax=Streptomyces tirandamycinicus TaxID=2174846 RepID=UPI0034179A38
MTTTEPEIVILSGSLGETSRTNRLAQWCARQCAPRAHPTVFAGADLAFPFYQPHLADPAPQTRPFLGALSRADGVVVISPAYHGTVSGLLKNALDYVNELADAPQPYLDGRPLGCVAIGAGDQGAASTLQTLRTVGHALRSWPTPMGVGLSQTRAELTGDGEPVDEQARNQLRVMTEQVITLARINARRRAARAAARVNDLPAAPVSAGGVR